MKKHTLKNIISSAAMLMVLLYVVSCTNNLPTELKISQELILDSHEMNIGDTTVFKVSAYAPSVWRASTSAPWCSIEKPLYSGKSSVTCKVEANRGTGPREFYVVIETFYKDNPIIDSVRVIQEVNTKPILLVKPLANRLVSTDGEKFDLEIEYNYGVNMTLTYMDSEEGWITYAPTELPASDITPVTAKINFDIPENTNQEQRVAQLVFESTQPGGTPSRMTITQKAALPLAPTVTGFADDFETVTTQGQLYKGEGWSFEANPAGREITFKQFTNGMKALLIHGGGVQATVYGLMPPFNVNSMMNKSLTYKWAPGNTIAAGKEKFEVVASTDYKDDAFKATWFVVEDVTNREDPTKIRPLEMQRVDLSSLAHLERVYIAFRYTGASSAYRFDDVKVGDVD